MSQILNPEKIMRISVLGYNFADWVKQFKKAFKQSDGTYDYMAYFSQLNNPGGFYLLIGSIGLDETNQFLNSLLTPTIDKIEILNECISSIRKQGYDILVSTHIEVSKEINDVVDYVVYDKENPLIMYDEYLNNPSVVYVWMSLPGYEQNYPIKFNHAYAVMRLIQNICPHKLCTSY